MRIAVIPHRAEPIVAAAVAGGGMPATDPAEADAIVWTDPFNVPGLRDALAASPARWVQLPFAGIESFVDAGVITPDRIWTCAKGIYGRATAEQALALVLLAARRLHLHARSRTWVHDQSGHRRLEGSTALVVGTGGIGEAFASMAAPLGIRILASNRSGSPAPWAERTEPASALPSLAAEADWIVVAAPLTPETHHLIGRAVIGAMRADAWIVNVARGGLVDTDAVVAALREERIGGAALDVTDPEPLPDDHPLWTLPNAIVTSHTGNTTQMAIPALAALVERNVRRFVAGEPLEGLVDPSLGY